MPANLLAPRVSLARRLAHSALGLFLLPLALACGTEPPAAATAPTAGCAPGSSTACTCEPDGRPGTQRCGDDGQLLACECAVAAAAPVAAEAPAPEVVAAPAAPAEPAVAEPAASIAPEPGVYEVTIAREGECLSLAGPSRKLPATTRTQRWKIGVAGPNTLTIHDGHKERRATLTHGEYVFDRPSELGRALFRLSFEADAVRGTGTASAVSHRGRNRKTAEDCGETFTITGRKA
jgi:hypothetical protein